MAEHTNNFEMQRQLDELRRELRDTRTNTINWWLAVNGFILTFFGIIVVIGGYVGFTRFQQIEIEARSILGEAQGILGEIRQTKQAGDQLITELKRDRELLAGDEVVKSEPSQEMAQEPAQEPKPGAPLDAEAYNAQGLAKRKQGQLDEAIADYNKAIELRPNFAEAYNNRGVAKEKQDLLFEALADYDRAIELRPNYPEAYNNRGNVKQVFNRFKEAIADYDRAIELRPRYSSAYNNRAITKERLGFVVEALADYDRAIELRPDFAETYYNRGQLRIASGFTVPGRDDLRNAFNFARRDGNRELELKAETSLALSSPVLLPSLPGSCPSC